MNIKTIIHLLNLLVHWGLHISFLSQCCMLRVLLRYINFPWGFLCSLPRRSYSLLPLISDWWKFCMLPGNFASSWNCICCLCRIFFKVGSKFVDWVCVDVALAFPSGWEKLAPDHNYHLTCTACSAKICWKLVGLRFRFSLGRSVRSSMQDIIRQGILKTSVLIGDLERLSNLTLTPKSVWRSRYLLFITIASCWMNSSMAVTKQ